jgi:2-dehydro-3-deoxy-D-arabinonate dehydratase
MKLYRTQEGILVEKDNVYYRSDLPDWNMLVNHPHLPAYLAAAVEKTPLTGLVTDFSPEGALPPVVGQEVWASGVTYYRSKVARMEESQDAGGGTFYDRVYDAQRPELFFKSSPSKVIGPGGKVRIRRDSAWNVPEPELTLFINSAGQVAGYTIGNDMSSRDIEGENPLYLPQAKVYDGGAAGTYRQGPRAAPLPLETPVRIQILRGDTVAFSGETALTQLKRKFAELAGYLCREMSFPQGCYLMTGTGIVPPNDFTLRSGDEIRITIDPIGTLANVVE